MSTPETQDAATPVEQTVASPVQDTVAPAAAPKPRPRLDLNTGPKERRRGKSMFGLVVGTLTKAKIEDKERNASEAAKKRQLIDQRLQNKLRKETDSVRRAEEAKKDRSTANRKEEDLQLKDSIYKFRRRTLPHLSRFLCTSDNIPLDDSTPPPAPSNPLSQPQRSHPPPLYYLPATLLPAQEAFLNQRVEQVQEAVTKEWDAFRQECKDGIEEIVKLRQRVAEEEKRTKSEPESKDDEMKEISDAPKDVDADGDADMGDGMQVDDDSSSTKPVLDGGATQKEGRGSVGVKQAAEQENKEEPMQADDDEVVEY